MGFFVPLHSEITKGKKRVTDIQIPQNYDEAYSALRDMINWAHENDLPMQDYFAENCSHRLSTCESEEERCRFVEAVKKAIQEMKAHLQRGKELGLSLLEQRTLDTLWSWVPHDYPENYVACAREVSEAIVRLLPPEDEERSEEGYIAYYNQVIEEVKRLAEKYDVDFDTSGYSLSAGYFYEWLSKEYGMIFDDAYDREV